jgi:hypothetical protein
MRGALRENENRSIPRATERMRAMDEDERREMRGNRDVGTFSMHKRREKGLTLEDMAKEAGVSLRQVYLFEIGGSISLEMEEVIQKAYRRLGVQEPAQEQAPIVTSTMSRPQGVRGGHHDLHQ